MTVRVFDIDGTERDLAWLSSNYDGCHPEFVSDKIDISAWERYFKLVAIYCTTGDAITKVEVLNETGAPMNMIWACTSWPSLASPAADLDDLSSSGAPYIWTSRGKVQRTDERGITGFGLGTAYGPFYQMWIVSPSTPSDCLVMSGMKGGTPHNGPLHALFQLTEIEAQVPPIDTGTPDIEYTKAVAMTLASQFVLISNENQQVQYFYMEPEEVVRRSVEIERCIRAAYEE